MIHRTTPLLLVLGLLIAWPQSAFAGPNPDFKLILHAAPMPEKKRSVTCFSHLPKEPTGIVTEAGLYPEEYIVYVIITDFSPKFGVAGVQFGISYNGKENEGVDIQGAWKSCTLYEWPMEDWPASNTGNLLTWNQAEDCQESFPLPVGFFTVIAYSPDRLKLIPRPVDGLARIAVCGINTVNSREKVDNAKLDALGWIDFGGGPGYNPWDPQQNPNTMKFKPIKD